MASDILESKKNLQQTLSQFNQFKSQIDYLKKEKEKKSRRIAAYQRWVNQKQEVSNFK